MYTQQLILLRKCWAKEWDNDVAKMAQSANHMSRIEEFLSVIVRTESIELTACVSVD